MGRVVFKADFGRRKDFQLRGAGEKGKIELPPVHVHFAETGPFENGSAARHISAQIRPVFGFHHRVLLDSYRSMFPHGLDDVPTRPEGGRPAVFRFRMPGRGGDLESFHPLLGNSLLDVRKIASVAAPV